MQKLVIYATILAFIISASVFFPHVMAVKTTSYNILAVENSEGCQRMLDNNMQTTCPTLDKIWKYDTTNKNISGKMILVNGKYVRSHPQVRNHYLFYENMTVCVDCSLSNLSGPDVLKTIFIEPSNFVYINKTEGSSNHKYTTQSNRYVSPDCMTSTIGYNDYLLNDTISYMLSGCTKTNIHLNQTNTIKDTPFEMNNPYSSLHYKDQITKLKQNPMKNCITKKCATPPNPYKKPGW